jgi:hypothetical protein
MSVKALSDPESRDLGGSWGDLSLSSLPLFQRPAPSPPYQVHNETSRTAAQSIAPAAGTLRARVLAVIEAAPGGLTDEEGCERTGMNPSTWRPRRGELEKGGFIRDSGRTRKSTAGRDMVVWAAGRAAGDHDGAP